MTAHHVIIVPWAFEILRIDTKQVYFSSLLTMCQ